METVIETAIATLAVKAENANAPHEAMQFAQAALNLAHVKEKLVGAKRLTETETENLRAALLMAVCQNEHDMLMTGEELRVCRAALGG